MQQRREGGRWGEFISHPLSALRWIDENTRRSRWIEGVVGGRSINTCLQQKHSRGGV
jgi:hypothetical protein